MSWGREPYVAYCTKKGAQMLEVHVSYDDALESLRPALATEKPEDPAYYERDGDLVLAPCAFPDYTIEIEKANQFLVQYGDNPSVLRLYADAMELCWETKGDFLRRW